MILELIWIDPFMSSLGQLILDWSSKQLKAVYQNYIKP